jgi:hypothetical protein
MTNFVPFSAMSTSTVLVLLDALELLAVPPVWVAATMAVKANAVTQTVVANVRGRKRMFMRRASCGHRCGAGAPRGRPEGVRRRCYGRFFSLPRHCQPRDDSDQAGAVLRVGPDQFRPEPR